MPTEIRGSVFERSTATLLARVVGNDDSRVQQADISSAVYSVYLIDEDDEDTLTVIEGHDGVALTVADLIYDTLQEDDLWGDKDETGYNFRHTVDISANQAFEFVGRAYRVEFTLTPTSGQIITVRFRLDCK